MENRRKLTREQRQLIVDWFVEKATEGLYRGDGRDDEAPPISLENFSSEMFRHGAIALRRRLSRLSDKTLLAEVDAAGLYLGQFENFKSEALAQAERLQHEDAEQANRRRQADIGRRHGLQTGILEAARHYRDSGMTAKSAWKELETKPFRASNGYIVSITGDEMRQDAPNRTHKRTGIGFNHWRDRYWNAAREKESG